MKLYYTNPANDLTLLLSQEAKAYADAGKRVFYIAPNSLSFEKERKVLSFLPEQASFAITVTRFTQMARYFTLNAEQNEDSIDDLGLSMVFYRVLTSLSDSQLTFYRQVQTSPAFIEQLVNLYKELQVTGLDITDLRGLAPEKLADLTLIFNQVSELLGRLSYSRQTALSSFLEQLNHPQLQQQLANTVVVVDGFTRFTAEEETLLQQLNSYCDDVIVGVYASQTSYKATYSAGNLYQASLDLLRELAASYQVKPEYLGPNEGDTAFSSLTSLVESHYDFRPNPLTIDQEKERYPIELWHCLSVKEELEHVAKRIRAYLQQGGRYKDISLLLGDVEVYRLPLSEVFAKYEIPYYLGQAKAMSSHPLVQVIDSLERLVRYNYRSEDLLNLLKSSLVGQFSDLELARYDQYLTYADIKGKRAFDKPFTKGSKNFDLDALNQTHQTLWLPLSAFLSGKKQSLKQIVSNLLDFFKEMNLLDNLFELASQSNQLEAEEHQEVWKTFCQIVEQMTKIFDGHDMTVADCLSLLSSAMLQATYRVVPATLDVVTVKSYTMIEPHSKPLVFAIGLSQSNFPEIVQTVSLISEQERDLINDKLEAAQLAISSRDNLKRNHYIFVSLLNSATNHLILSSPAQFDEGEGQTSTYFQVLEKVGLEIEQKGRSRFDISPDDLGTYRAVLSRLVDAYQEDISKEMLDKDKAVYWSVVLRVLRNKLKEEGLQLPVISNDLPVSPVSQEVLAVRYPADQPINLSVSALTTFYKNEYAYFVDQILRLKEEETIHPDARQHGIFMHKVLELLTQKEEDLSAILAEVGEMDFAQEAYNSNEQDRFSRQLLEDMLAVTATVLEKETGLLVEEEEKDFGIRQPNLLTLSNGRQVNIRGKIDRLDRLDGQETYGVVDYKSGDNDFDLKDFYNKLSPQLLTYLSALKAEGKDKLLGAYYLQLKNPSVKLAEASNLDTILSKAEGELLYKGLTNSDFSSALFKLPKKKNDFSPEELDLMMAYNDLLYRQAAEKILSGHFAINPYTEDERTVAGDQIKRLTRFEADVHMNLARRLETFSGFSGKGSKEARRQAIFDRMRSALENESEED